MSHEDIELLKIELLLLCAIYYDLKWLPQVMFNLQSIRQLKKNKNEECLLILQVWSFCTESIAILVFKS